MTASEGPPAFVTGASGFIGRHLVRALLAEGRRVVALCRERDALADVACGRLAIAAASLDDLSACAAHLEPGMSVFHLAGVRSVPGTAPEAFDRTNRQAAVALARHAARTGVARFVYLSSAHIFGPSQGSPVSEETGMADTRTGGAYLRSRVLAMQEMAPLVGLGLPLVTVCPSITFGPDHPTHPNRLTDQIRRLLRSRVDLTIGAGDRRRSLAYVEDVARGICQAEQRGAVGETYILGGEAISHREFNLAVRAVAGCPSRLRLRLPVGAARAGAAAADALLGHDAQCGYASALHALLQEWRSDSAKAARDLGYVATPLREAIRRTVQFVGNARQPALGRPGHSGERRGR